MYTAFIHGFILALGLILPLGAQNVFVFNQGAIQKRYLNAPPVIMTASLCDTLLITLAVLGVSVIVLGSFWLKTLLMGGGFFFLLYMGWVTWKSKPHSTSQDIQAFSPKKQVLFALSVSIINPHAIMDTIGVIGTNSLNYGGSEKLVFTLATILVSWIWFFSLALAGRFVGRLDKEGHFITVLNKVSALIIWGVALYMGSSLLQ